MGDDSILEAGTNSWEIAASDRVGFLLEGRAYFRAVREAMKAAKERIVVIGWDIHSGLRLIRGEESDGLPSELGPFLEALLERNEELEIHILIWDFALVYATEREWRSSSETWSDPHPRLHFRFDGALPTGASHHQKIIQIDRSLAFSGGFDLGLWRWDTTEHRVDDERRDNPLEENYPPFHDIGIVMTGPIAERVEEVCRARWRRGTGMELADCSENTEFWPEGAELVREGIELAISRTYARYDPHGEIFEIERLHLDIIASAEKWIYLENQYFTSRTITEAIEQRLREEDGPEIVILLNQSTGGWLEESTMGVMRDRFLNRLADADEYDRLSLFYPVARESGGAERQVYIHAKVVIADGRLVKIGSSNLSNRSMRVDSEIDFSIDDEEGGLANEILHRLLAIHFDTEPATVASRFEEEGSIWEVIDSFREARGNTLFRLEHGLHNPILEKLADSEILDPEEPINPEFWIRQHIHPKENAPARRRLTWVVGLVGLGILLVALFQWGWGNVIDEDSIRNLFESIRAERLAIPILFAILVIVGLIGLPLNLFLVAAVVVFGPVVGFFVSYLGFHASAGVGFHLGRRFGNPLLARFTSRKLDRLNEQLVKRGVLSIMILRVVPVAPFVVINAAAGASSVTGKSFHLGTLCGMLPGMLAVTLLTNQVGDVIRNPGWASILLLVFILLVVAGGLWSLYRALRSRSVQSDAHTSDL